MKTNVDIKKLIRIADSYGVKPIDGGYIRLSDDGVTSYEEDGTVRFNFDWNKDSHKDLVRLTEQKPKEVMRDGNVYYFGYEWLGKKDVVQAAFFKALKGFDNKHPNTQNFEKFIIEPLNALSEKAQLHNVGCVIYPQSSSKLNRYMLKKLHPIFLDPNFETYEAVKRAVTKVNFDFKSFTITNYVEDPPTPKEVNQMKLKAKNWENNTIDIKKIPEKYRPYFRDFLKLPKEVQSLVGAESVLVVDDILSTGTTIKEMIRLIRVVNDICKIYVYSILGDYKKDF